MEFLKKNLFVIAWALFGICALIILASIKSMPTARPSPTTQETVSTTEAISTETLQIRDLVRRMDQAEENIKKLYNNQLAINKKLSELVEADKLLEQGNKDNRAYIAMIYQKVLDMELQIKSLGGGFNLRNPLLGTEALPENNP